MEKMMNTDAPIVRRSVGKVMPIMKLKNHDDKLPIDIATGRGPTSKSSEEEILFWKHVVWNENSNITASSKERNRSESNLVDENVPKQGNDTESRKNRWTFLKMVGKDKFLWTLA